MTDWNAPTDRQSGDVRLSGERQTPVGLGATEDVFVAPGSIDGTLHVEDAEYVFTDVPANGTASDPTVRKAITGDLEDGYVEDVPGDVVLRNVEDVFVAHEAANALDASGAEQVFHDDGTAPTAVPDGFDVTLSGWQHARETRDPRNGILIRGAKNDVHVTEASRDLTVYIIGWDNEVRIEGHDGDVTVFFVGRDNEVRVGPYLSASTAAESGYDNRVAVDPIPPEAVIETSKDEAFDHATIGRHKLTWQEPTDKEWCPNCGSEADAVVKRRQKDAFFVFSVAIRSYDDGGVSYECEHCSPHAVGPVSLSEDERRNVLR
ncbi:hypothetical protein [Halorhabdus amylolytica]|uniref:hypothetical protein n=1 Tax=Halorhabdus amylolytica TaxID=2559573 RepID=UPI0010A9EB13|nr:hypothetical protein [Halorhabdus amylolytica]